MDNSMVDILTGVGIPRNRAQTYADTLIQNGVDTKDKLLYLTDEELKNDIQMILGDRSAIRSIKPQQVESPLKKIKYTPFEEVQREEMNLLKNLYQSCIERATCLKILKTNFVKEQVKFQSNVLIPNTIGRVTEMQIAVDQIFKRWKAYKEKETFTDEERRTYNRVLAISCLPGGGKTHFLDSLSLYSTRMKGISLHKFLEEEDQNLVASFKNYFDSILFIKVSFNSWSSSFNPDNLESDVAIRILYSFFCKTPTSNTEDKNEFGQFSKSFLSVCNNYLTIDVALCILDYYFTEILRQKIPPYMILVDELEKTSNAKELCSKICKLLDERKIQFEALFTSLDYVWVTQVAKTSSDRFVSWIPMNPPSYNAVSTIEGFPHTEPVRFILSEVSTHWRSIVSFLKICMETSQALLSDYKFLQDKLSSSLKDFLPTLQQFHIELCFRRETVALEFVLPNGKRVAEEIKTGYFINTVEKDLKIIPDISSSLLRQWAFSNDSYFGMSNTEEELIDHFKFQLKSIFYLDLVSWNYSSFETFYTHWHSIRSFCIGNSNSSIRKFYAKCGVRSKRWRNCEIQVQQQMRVYDCSDISCIGSKPKVNTIYLLGKANPGFDSLVFFKERNTESLVAVAIENRYSAPESTTVFSKSDAISKKNDTLTNIKENLKISSKQIYLILCYWRNMPKYLQYPLKKSDQLPQNTLLLRKEDLEFLFGPLGRRPYYGFEVVEDEVKENCEEILFDDESE